MVLRLPAELLEESGDSGRLGVRLIRDEDKVKVERGGVELKFLTGLLDCVSIVSKFT